MKQKDVFILLDVKIFYQFMLRFFFLFSFIQVVHFKMFSVSFLPLAWHLSLYASLDYYDGPNI